MLGFHPDDLNEITWTPFLQLLSRVDWVKVEYAHGIPSVCLEDFDDEVVDEDVILVYDEVVDDDALVVSLKAYLAPWPQGCSVRHVLDHWERSRNRFKGIGSEYKIC